MPKRTDIKSIMIIGAGPIVIGQACEFDYSGAQACKALREEGYRVILVNSNPATIMTDPGLADATYIEPITPEVVAKIIEKERPDALLPTMGGQTGLNTSLALEEMGVLAKFGVEMIGAKREAIEMAEDRKLFREAMDRIGLENPKATIVAAPRRKTASTTSAPASLCMDALEDVGLPAIIRPAFTLGGTGGGVAYNRDDYAEICRRGLEASPHGPDPHRRIPPRLEGVRDGGGPRPQGQRDHRLLDRERGPDGRAHRATRSPWPPPSR
jgi:carbamoyl-phosphate synthase large subunit